jgi:hypothetical protein
MVSPGADPLGKALDAYPQMTQRCPELAKRIFAEAGVKSASSAQAADCVCVVAKTPGFQGALLWWGENPACRGDHNQGYGKQHALRCILLTDANIIQCRTIQTHKEGTDNGAKDSHISS